VPTEEEKAIFLNEHVSYEIMELLNCCLFWGSSQRHSNTINSRGQGQVFLNIAIDHLLLHARNLLEFFCYKKAEDTAYASAESHIPEWTKPTLSPAMLGVQRRVNVEITHLVWKRLEIKTIEDKLWNPLDIADGFLVIINKFVSDLDKKYYRQEFQSLVDFLKRNPLRHEKVEGGERIIFATDFFEGMNFTSDGQPSVAAS